ncbi:helix-turn-helix transcriptional regulator [Ponticoccus litoralis]|uniref:LuxR C-terminal-related transcriptional regulator n=1 Tax=Ponticoccus litoralis TaxID=422297 RepID=A0AAW9SQC7_9RHOB
MVRRLTAGVVFFSVRIVWGYSVMLPKLSKAVCGLSAAADMAELGTAMASAAQELGFVSFNITIDKRHAVELMEEPLLTTWSREDLLAYSRDDWAAKDPLLQSAVQRETPFLWSAEGWRNSGHCEYSEYLALNGIAGGATVPLGGGPGKLGAMTFLAVSDDALTADSLHATNVLALFALARVQVLREGITLQSRAPDPLQSLSRRQVDILHWVAEGKTNREIAVIMGSTLSTINYHLEQIRQKLGVSNRTSAAALYKGVGAPRG